MCETSASKSVEAVIHRYFFIPLITRQVLYVHVAGLTAESDQKVFLNHNKSFRLHLGDYEKHIFSPFEGL